LNTKPPDMEEWKQLVDKAKNLAYQTEIAIVGKYVALHDAYLSIVEALGHAGIANNTEVQIRWVNAESVTDDNAAEIFAGISAILVPGGFGDRGIEGKVSAIRYARENKVPFFGICLGMQVAVVEFARSVCLLDDANSSEIDANCQHPVIDLLPEQKDIEDLGGTMRLGLYPCKLAPGSLAMACYEEELIYERHRHRYEFNNQYRDLLQQAGLHFSNASPDGRLIEIIELPEHPWFIAVQFHPEFISRPDRPQKLFYSFVKAALNRQF